MYRADHSTVLVLINAAFVSVEVSNQSNMSYHLSRAYPALRCELSCEWQLHSIGAGTFAIALSFLISASPYAGAVFVSVVVVVVDLPDIIKRLNKNFAEPSGLTLSVRREDAPPGFWPEGTQPHIDSYLKIEESDIFIGILWKAFGTPGQDAKTRTEHEFYKAYKAWKKIKDLKS